jgi:hypothetical protein
MRQVMIKRSIQSFGLALALLTSANVATCFVRGDEPKSQTFPPSVPQPSIPMPVAGTPIGLPGPPHIPLGSPGGISQYPSDTGGFSWTSNQRSDELIRRYQDAKRSRELNDLQLQELHRQARASLKATMVREHRMRVQRVKLGRERLDAVEKQLEHRFDNLDLFVDSELAKRFNHPADVAKALPDEARRKSELRSEVMKLLIEALVELDTDVATSEQLQNGLPAGDPRRDATMTRTERLRGLGTTLRGNIESLKTVDLQGASWDPSGAIDVTAPKAAVRHFVCLVVDADRITFEGQSTTWETLPKLLEKVPNRPFTVFEFAFASDDLTKRQKSEVIARCVRMNEQFGFEYPSYTGIKPLGSKGSPSQDRKKQDARARY